MMVDTTVYGWYRIDDGEVVCSDCAGLDYVPELLRDSGEWSPLYALDDTEEGGLPCDDGSIRCRGFVFEPAPEYCNVHDEAHWDDSDIEEDCVLYRDR